MSKCTTSNTITPNLSRLATFRPRTSDLVAPALLALVFVVAVLFRPGAIDPIAYSRDLAEAVLRNGTGRALLALGAGLVLASAGVDLSMAGVLALSGVLFAWGTQSITTGSVGVTVVILFAGLVSLVGAAIGTFNGWAIAKWKSPPLILTWAVGAITLILAAVFAGLLSRLLGTSAPIGNASGIPVAASISRFSSDVRFLSAILTFLFIALPTSIGAFNLGRNARAIGANRISATYAGIRVRRVLIATYAASGALAALAGVWFSLLEGKALTTTYIGVELSAIAIAVLGGTAMSGGYFSVIPIVCAAFLWSLLLSVLQRPDLLPAVFDAQIQSRAAEATFAFLLIAVVIWAGRRLSGDTVSINVISRLEEE